MKEKLKTLLTRLNILKPVNPKLLIALGIGVLGTSLGLSYLSDLSSNSNDIRASSVMIVNHEATHGGTGIIVKSDLDESSILTNDHVCRAVKTGGIVRSSKGDFQIVSMIESELSDLCLIQVADDLGVNTTIANRAPRLYENIQVSGHPALMPNVISKGHLSGRSIIQVMTGIRPCTKEDNEAGLGMVCFFFGGIPVVKSYESVLVSATIMPGSSGSGVYNSDNDLTGVVFAGSSDFGYAWTVPFEQVVHFVTKEHQKLKKQNLSQEVDILGQKEEKRLKEVLKKCESNTNETIENYCNMLKKDVTWLK